MATGLDGPLRGEVFVALDLEFTGTDPQRDEVMEVGAVRFRPGQVLETFHRLVNPYRPVPPEVQRLTGITDRDLRQAPPLAVVAGELEEFVGGAPVVGHSVAQDLAFLERRGVAFPGPVLDTYELAHVLLPRGEYSLHALARALGARHLPRHRALDDALATAEVFSLLVERLLALDPAVVAELERLAGLAGSPLRFLYRSALQALEGRPSSLGPGGLDLALLERRLRVPPSPLRPAPEPVPVSEEEVEGFFGPQGPLARTLPGYEARPQQAEMARAVARALSEGGTLLVEAGTGVGKTLAYLLPAALYALRHGRRVVVSTHTLNLQEQLATKDLPLLVQALGEEGRRLRWAVLKGRGNYLCLRRWARARSTPALSPEEARLLCKTLVWLQGTPTGDRAELTLPLRDAEVWERLSAQAGRECPPEQGPCFLRFARDRAESAHLVIVNHALLMADIAREGGLLPPYDCLIVDEAHNLEEEATRQLGFALSLDRWEEPLEALAGPRGLAVAAVQAYRTATASEARRAATAEAAAEVEGAVARARERLRSLYAACGALLQRRREEERALRLDPALRGQPSWGHVLRAWEDTRLALEDLQAALRRLLLSLEGLEEAGLLDYEALRADLQARSADLEELTLQAEELFTAPRDGYVYWLEMGERGVGVLQGAPLEVGPLLRERLFGPRRAVVLTSATLTAGGSFAHLRERLGVEEAREVALGSPFDFRRSALLCVLSDMPEPTAPDYTRALAETVAQLVRVAGGRTLVLFTAHSALRHARRALLPLEKEGFRVLAQGVDGPPAQLAQRFQEDPRAVLLGTSSFWEGVDLAEGVLRVLVLARLPFAVPTDPLVAARAERYEDPFTQYSLPQAVLRFRQGFGRLVRRKGDRGVVVVMDRRILSRNYGPWFVRSLPPCTARKVELRQLPDEVARWLEG